MSGSICFDARMAQASGIGTYIRGLLKALADLGTVVPAMTLLTDPPNGVVGPWARIPVSDRFYSWREQISVPQAFRRSGAQLLHVPHYNVPIWLASRSIVTVHDLIHLKFPEFLPSRLAWLYAQSFFRHWVPKTRAILTVSENTKKDIITMLGIPETKITVTPPGVPDGFRELKRADVEAGLRPLGLTPGYFLYVGNLKEFKNTPRLLKSYRDLHQRHPECPPFVFVGKNFIAGFDQELQKHPSVRWFPALDREMLPLMYAGAKALVFPSLYEGFGLPPLEAMACGTPVICSDRGSLPEVVGDAAVTVDPLNEEEIMTAMRRIWQEPNLGASLSIKGRERSRRFNWQTTAERTLGVYQQVLA
jgi:glycosyltransferase involved in cell wall biosynthesis